MDRSSQELSQRDLNREGQEKQHDRDQFLLDVVNVVTILVICVGALTMFILFIIVCIGHAMKWEVSFYQTILTHGATLMLGVLLAKLQQVGIIPVVNKK